jgi:hypothetical protein
MVEESSHIKHETPRVNRVKIISGESPGNVKKPAYIV